MSSVSTATSASSSTTSPMSVTALGTGIDWQSIVSQMTQVSDQALVPYQNDISTCNSEISAWQTFASDLNSLQTASNALQSSTALNLYSANVTSSSSTSASSLLSASASSSANTGSYNVVINNIAQAEQLASGTFSSEDSALNISGTILVNGQAVNIASTDTLQDLQTEINNLDSGTNPTGVSAAIAQISSNAYRLVLTSDSTGASGISLLDGSSSGSPSQGTDTLGQLGFNAVGNCVIANQVAGGAQSQSFSSTNPNIPTNATAANTPVATLLGLGTTSGLSGSVTIDGVSGINLDLDTQSLDDIASTITTALQNAGVNDSASVVSTTNGTTTTYNLQISGMTSANSTDSGNVLQALGLLQGNRASVIGVSGSVANTTDGSTPISSSTLISSIYGYTYNTGDTITISGTNHSGSAVSTNFTISSASTVGDLLNAIDSAFGNVTASVTSNGTIQVADNASGASSLSVNLAANIGANSGVLSFGTFGQVGAIQQYVLQQGQDASFTVDGMNMTSSSNSVTNAISGVTLNMLGADPNTTLTVNIDPDTSGIESLVNSWLSAYNTVQSFVNTQNTYNTTSNTTGGPLFGDVDLNMIAAQLRSEMLQSVGSGSVSYLADIGITSDSNGNFSLNTATFEQALSSNFQSVVNIFSDSGVCSNNQFQYVASSGNTQAGTYDIDVTQLPGSDQDIAGTIDGQTASGSGNLLTLNNAASGADGLSISYSGNTVPASATITVNRGIASLIDGLVNQFTDPKNGVITAQQQQLQTTVSGLNTQVTNMQANINAQMADLTNQFINMDTAVAQLNSLQSYLTAQFANLA